MSETTTIPDPGLCDPGNYSATDRQLDAAALAAVKEPVALPAWQTKIAPPTPVAVTTVDTLPLDGGMSLQIERKPNYTSYQICGKCRVAWEGHSQASVEEYEREALAIIERAAADLRRKIHAEDAANSQTILEQASADGERTVAP
jgi:hypothetical protein